MSYLLYPGDNLEILPQMAEECLQFDCVVTDPPYGLSFMGKEWDHGVPAKHTWGLVLKVMKPGAMLLAFGGTRTHHRLMCAIEDAGFEIRDCLMWIYGSGFPKSMDISKAIDKAARGVPQGGADPTSANHGKFKGGCSEDNPGGRGFGAGPGQFMAEAGEHQKPTLVPEAQPWNGYGTALKPAYEPIILAMKPCDGTFAENALKYGVAGLNIDGSRIKTTDSLNGGAYSGGTRPTSAMGCTGEVGGTNSMLEAGGGRLPAGSFQQPPGRWPANVILDEEAGMMLDEQTGNRPGCKSPSSAKPESKYRPGQGNYQEQGPIYPDDGGASRFFYCAKASSKERRDSKHPSVKPLSLMRYLVKLVCPKDGVVLDPFAGSGSTGEAGALEGFDVVMIEKEPEYCKDIERRMEGLQ